MEESKEELKSLLLKVKEESGNTLLKLNIQKMKVLPYIKMNLPQVYMCSPSWTLLPPPSPYHPSGLSQCTSPKHPVLCIEPGLAKPIQYCKVKYNIIKKKMKVMASGSMPSWQIDGETVEQVSDFVFGGSKITADGDYSHEIKRRLLRGRIKLWPT